MNKTLVVATGNPGKVKEMQAYMMGLEVELQPKPDDLEVEETGQTFYDNACLKASTIAKVTNSWAIADDSGLEVKALGGAPGVYSARYAATDQERINRILTELENHSDRSAQFVCLVAVARPDGTIALTTEGICEGVIAKQPAGQGGFGYDPIFYVPSLELTFAEMTPTQKKAISHRGRAFVELMPKMRKLINQEF
jgi:XTP/dITP diphosphohydrolase